MLLFIISGLELFAEKPQPWEIKASKKLIDFFCMSLNSSNSGQTQKADILLPQCNHLEVLAFKAVNVRLTDGREILWGERSETCRPAGEGSDH